MQKTTREMQEIIVLIIRVFTDAEQDAPARFQSIKQQNEQAAQFAEISKNIGGINQIVTVLAGRQKLIQVLIKQTGI